MPVPRKFDRRPPERDQTRINDRIRVPEVRVVGEKEAAQAAVSVREHHGTNEGIQPVKDFAESLRGRL